MSASDCTANDSLDLAITARRVLARLLESESPEARIEAAKAILDRAGFTPFRGIETPTRDRTVRRDDAAKRIAAVEARPLTEAESYLVEAALDHGFRTVKDDGT